MIRHQAVSVEEEWEFEFLHPQLREKLLIIIPSVENSLPVVPTREDMVEPALDFDSRLSRHDGGCYERKTAVSTASRPQLTAKGFARTCEDNCKWCRRWFPQDWLDLSIRRIANSRPD